MATADNFSQQDWREMLIAVQEYANGAHGRGHLATAAGYWALAAKVQDQTGDASGAAWARSISGGLFVEVDRQNAASPKSEAAASLDDVFARAAILGPPDDSEAI